MNELQKTEFALLQEFDRVCKALELPYFLACGSALGAVKYGGFIPWDDDIDVALYREDYERFIREAPGLLPAGLFLQNHHTQPRFPQIYSKLRNSQTAFVEKSAAALPINHGVFIDIFPLDGYPEKKRQQKRLEFQKRLYGSMLLSAYDLPRTGALHRFWRLCGAAKHPDRVARALEKRLRAWPVAGSEWICNHGNWQGKLEYAPAWHYGAGAEACFEGLSVRVPEQFDAYLRQKYGDYTAELPPEQQVGHHTWAVCDCAKPYTVYVSQKEGK